jgi:hypothetical protein
VPGPGPDRGARASGGVAPRAGWGSPFDRDERRVQQLRVALLLDRDGPGELGRLLAGLGDAAIVDTRVLLAHRLGADEGAWPPPEDRFASDLLLPDRIGDPWLCALTVAAVGAPITVLLGGHTLVGPGLRLVAEQVP